MFEKTLLSTHIEYKKIGNSIIFDIDSSFAHQIQEKFDHGSGFNMEKAKKRFLVKTFGNIRAAQNYMTFASVSHHLSIYLFREGGFRP